MTSLKRALNIGIDYEGGELELQGCSRDIADLTAWLHERGYDCTVLTDDTARAIVAHGTPDGETIRAELRALFTSAAEKQVLQLSAHGTYTPDGDGDEADGHDEVVIAGDYTYIFDDELRELLALAPAHRTVFILADCCHSGSMFDLSFEYSVGGGTTERPGDPAAVRADAVCISGCQDEQTAADAWDASARTFRGAMTAAFLDELHQATPFTPVGTFFEGVCARLRAQGHSQRPKLTFSRAGAPERPMCAYL